VLVLIEPSLAAIEPERALVELAVAPIEPLVEPVRSRAVVPFHAAVAVLDVPLPLLEASLDPIVVASGLCHG